MCTATTPVWRPPAVTVGAGSVNSDPMEVPYSFVACAVTSPKRSSVVIVSSGVSMSDPAADP